MPLEILGLISHHKASEDQAYPPKIFDKELMRRYALAHEASGYDRVLIAQSSFWPDSMPLAAYLAAVTERLCFMVAHRPGFVAPTMAARMFATLDHLSDGRAGIHIITAGNDKETQCDGDFLTKEQRYRRSREYVGILRRLWSAHAPVSYEGEFYRYIDAQSELLPVQTPSIPVYWGGSSPSAIEFAGECADIYAVRLEAQSYMRDIVRQVRDSAAAAGRPIAIQGTVRIILGETEQAAWDNARLLLDRLIANAAERRLKSGSAASLAVGGRSDPALSNLVNTSSLARFEALSKGEAILDDRLWVGPAKAGIPMASALVGTAEQIVTTLMQYYAFGVTGLMIRGFDLLEGAIEHGRELIPRLRAAVAEYDRTDRHG